MHLQTIYFPNEVFSDNESGLEKAAEIKGCGKLMKPEIKILIFAYYYRTYV